MHTKGPWELDSSDWPLIVNGPNDDLPNVVALLHCPEEGAEGADGAARNSYALHEQIANARLIAAAPALLEACEALLQSIYNTSQAAPCALAGIPNARELHAEAMAATAKARAAVAQATT